MVDSNVLVYNMQYKELKTRGYDDPKIDLQFKAIYGDRSDNIPKISSSITKDKAIMLAKMSNEERSAFLEENNIIDKYNFNMSLVSSEKIPDKYIDKYFSNITINLE